jgi:hypothetical protein
MGRKIHALGLGQNEPFQITKRNRTDHREARRAAGGRSSPDEEGISPAGRFS